LATGAQLLGGCDGRADKTGRICPSVDAAPVVTPDASSVDPCSSEALAACEIPDCGTVIVDIGGSDPQTTAIYDGPENKCFPIYRVRTIDRQKQCTNDLFWQQQARIFETMEQCESRCLQGPRVDAGEGETN